MIDTFANPFAPGGAATFSPATRAALISVAALIVIAVAFAHIMNVGDTSIVSNVSKASGAVRNLATKKKK